MPGKLSITGQVSVERYESGPKGSVWGILILGPTGAGKSRFIEALSGVGQSLGISKDQLAGFTQEVTAYQVKNAIVEWKSYTSTVYLIDTPGFSDSKISELEIITKVKWWMRAHGVLGIHGVLYLTPITDTRVSGSKRRTIKMIQSLFPDLSFNSVNIVTTMWDRLSNPQAIKRAETHFAQLQDEIWKGPISGGAKISRHNNNFDSTVLILRDNIDTEGSRYIPLGVAPIKRGDASAPFLYQELLERISNARQEKELLQQDKIQLISEPDPQLEAVVLSILPGVKNDLAKFFGQLVAFGTPPPGFEGVPERCIYQYLLDQVNETREEQAALKHALAHLHMNPGWERKAMLQGQFNLVKRELTQHVKQLGQYGGPPEGFERELERALDSISFGAAFQYHVERGFRPFKSGLSFGPRRNIDH